MFLTRSDSLVGSRSQRMVYDEVDLLEVSRGPKVGEVEYGLCKPPGKPRRIFPFVVCAFSNLTSPHPHFLQCLELQSE